MDAERVVRGPVSAAHRRPLLLREFVQDGVENYFIWENIPSLCIPSSMLCVRVCSKHLVVQAGRGEVLQHCGVGPCTVLTRFHEVPVSSLVSAGLATSSSLPDSSRPAMNTERAI